MGSNYLKNHLGFTLSDQQMEDVPYPTTELTTHVTLKTTQAFGLLGTVLVGPLAAVAKSQTRNVPGIVAKATKCGRGGMILGLVAGPLMTYSKVRNDPEEKIFDRCYRLRNNRGQVRVDRSSIVGGASGAAVAMAMGANPTFGLLAGMSTGIIGQAIYNSRSK